VKRCPACGDEYRKGTVVFLLLPTGELERKRVCQDCRGLGVRIVPMQSKGRFKACHHGSCMNLGKWCDEHRFLTPVFAQLERAIKVQLRMLQGPTMETLREHTRGRIEGLESALEIVHAMAEGRSP
jgi:hypothetical protein